MSSKHIVPVLVGVLIVGGSAFYGGTVYAKKTASAGSRNAMFQGQRPGGVGAGGQFRGPGGANGGGFTAGDVVSKDATSMTIKMRDGSSKIVFFSPSTTVGKIAQGSLEDVMQGTQVTVTGTPNQDGSVVATMIQIRPAEQTQGGEGAAAAPTDEQKAQLKAGEDAHDPTDLTFDVVGGSFYFTPNVIHVKKGDKVKIVFHDAGGMHNFTLDEFNVKMDTIKTGETATTEFTADKTGSFEYYCGVGQHRQMGQKGTIIVE